MIQLLLALRLTGPRAQFLAVPSYSPGRHLHGMGPGNLAEARRISGDPVSLDAVRCFRAKRLEVKKDTNINHF